DGYARLEDGPKHGELGGNFNTVNSSNKATIVWCESTLGTGHTMASPTRLYTNDHDVAFHMRHCGNTTVYYNRPLPAANDFKKGDVYWVADINGRMSETELATLLNKVEAGASAIIVCDEFSAIHDAVNKKTEPPPSHTFEDFESGTYAKWKVEGEAFGDVPATGTFPGQQKVSGWSGTYFVNSWVKGDGPTGTMTSPPFTVEHRFLHFLVGGGDHAGQTCINLVVDNEIVATERGQNTEQLRPVRWDIAAHKGKSATLQIVDSNTGGWGHVLVDQIQFSDSPRLALTDPALVERLRSALPFGARATKPYQDDVMPLHEKSPLKLPVGVAVKPAWIPRGFRLKKGAEVLARTVNGVPLLVAGSFGSGRLLICNGTLEHAATGNALKSIVGSLLANATGVAYTPQTGLTPESPLFGTLALGILPEDGVVPTACAQAPDFQSLWAQFANGGLSAFDDAPSAPGKTWLAALSGTVSLQPQDERTLNFVLAWHLPNRTRDDTYGWGPQRFQYDHRLGNRYNEWFKNAAGVIEYIADNHERLVEETQQFHTTFHNSTLPQYLLDAVTANASIVRSPIYVWLEDGTVGGFEGSDRCCPMNCTHVYNYAMSAAYLFPSIERNVRETDLLVQMHPTENYIPHRTILPLSLPRLGKSIGGPEHPALDGELGTVLKTYREWLMHGDRAWLSKVWPRVRDLMYYVMKEHDVDGDGVIKGEQPNTYDTHLFGSNTFIGTLYLAALRAAEEMAKLVGDADSATAFRDRFEKGRNGYDATCWDGEYYYNVFDALGADDNTYNTNNCYGPGCFSDQLLGQWWAHLLGLGYLLPEQRVKAALHAIYKHNWRASLSDHAHTQRVFAKGNEKGLLTGTWPKGGRPERPILYCDEVWTGIEYHVAATMIYEGMVTEGLQIVRGARERYTGSQRNPWSEIECGGHYARAMSSYSLLHAAAGFVYDAGTASISFAPRVTPDNFKSFFTASNGWGSMSQQRGANRQQNMLELRYGNLSLRSLSIALSETKGRPAQVLLSMDQRKVACNARFRQNSCIMSFAKPLDMSFGDTLRIDILWA
ncbi:MAG TPA: GH116 family glycosyl hydrolase, partial [Candidatus Hydrogenedentes bacterium]|nr:GH116 family glycosyl hydrolase [Candidatus Hydrogenedentota bacterium]